MNEEFVLATADTPDSQAKDLKDEQPETQNNDTTEAEAAPAAEAEATEAPAAEAEASTEEADAAVAVAEKPESELTMADLLDEYLPSKILRRGEIIDGKVMSRKPEGMLVDIGYKSEGFVPTKEMRSLAPEALDELTVGDEIIAYVVNPEGSEGSSILSIDRARGEQGGELRGGPALGLGGHPGLGGLRLSPGGGPEAGPHPASQERRRRSTLLHHRHP